MRLTLRTLLAYLDDTLEPREIREMSQKVAESNSAQELIQRVKNVTRRRRLTTPPDSGPGQRFDANVVAEYLDNELGSDEVAELEKLCLESDVHLAEIASCHQILTLILGQPALVPPTARERMYGLVQGREAIRTRKAQSQVPTRAALPSTDRDGEDISLLGLPVRLRTPWLRVILPIAGVLLLLVLGGILYMAMPRQQSVALVNTDTSSSSSSSNDQGKPTTTPDPDRDRTKPTEGSGEGSTPSDKPRPPKTGEPDRPSGPRKVGPEGDSDVEGDNDPFRLRVPMPGEKLGSRGKKSLPAPEPTKERVRVGKYYADSKSPASILVASKGEDWRRLTPGSPVQTGDTLVSLPGYSSQLRLDSGLHVLLRGYVPEMAPPDSPLLSFLLESSVVLSANKDADLDVTLRRGRLYVSNHKEEGGARVLLRFADQVWIIKLLEPGSEVGVDLIKHYFRGTDFRTGEDPINLAILWVMRGKVELIDEADQHFDMKAPPGPGMFRWDNKSQLPHTPDQVDNLLPSWSKEPFFPTGKAAREAAKQLSLALSEVSLKMANSSSPVLSLDEISQDIDPKKLPHRLLAVYAYGALDRPERLIETLGNSSLEGAPERLASILALQNWLAGDPKRGQKLYDPKTKTGLLLAGKLYQPGEAAILYHLLHQYNEEERQSQETYDALADYLQNQRVAIAELAWWQLRQLAQTPKGLLPELARMPFNAALPAADRDVPAEAIRTLIRNGKLPPGTTPPRRGPAPPEREKPARPPARPRDTDQGPTRLGGPSDTPDDTPPPRKPPARP